MFSFFAKFVTGTGSLTRIIIQTLLKINLQNTHVCVMLTEYPQNSNAVVLVLLEEKNKIRTDCFTFLFIQLGNLCLIQPIFYL